MAAPTAYQTGHWIGGEYMAPGTERIEVIDPATGAVAAEIPAGTAADVERAVAAARAAFRGWSATPVEERAAVVQRISDGLAARCDEIADTITAEMGSPITFARKVQATLPRATSAGVAALAEGFPWTEEIGNSLVVREPVGVVGAITPWNYPLHQIVAKVAPALLAGCTVVLKPSEIAPLTAGILAEIAAEAGVPAGVYNVVHGYGPTVGEAMAAHPGVDMMSFTGSARAGRRVSEVAAGSIKRVALELGGKSANIVLAEPTSAGPSSWASRSATSTVVRRARRGPGCWSRPTGTTRSSRWPWRRLPGTPSVTRPRSPPGSGRWRRRRSSSGWQATWNVGSRTGPRWRSAGRVRSTAWGAAPMYVPRCSRTWPRMR